MEKLKGLEMKAKTMAFYCASNSNNKTQKTAIGNNMSNLKCEYNSNTIFKGGSSKKKDLSLHNNDNIYNINNHYNNNSNTTNQSNFQEEDNQLEEKETCDIYLYQPLPKKQKIKLITNNNNTGKPTEIQDQKVKDEEISKIPYNYDSLMNMSVNCCKNVSSFRQSPNQSANMK